jgi:hypothetical protein
MVSRRAVRLIVFVVAAFLMARPPEARAGSLYYEFGMGAGTITNNGYFGSGYSGTSSLGAAANASMFYSFQGSAPLSLQLGLMDRFISVSAGSTTTMFNALYPALRIQLAVLYFGGGATLLNFADKGDGNFRLDSSALSLYAEGGVLWAVTPLFSLGGFGAIQMPSSAGATASSIELGAILRFYFWAGGGGGKSSGEYHGWRYPFGREIR